MLAAVMAWWVGTDISESGFVYDNYDSLIAGSGIAVLILALLASLRRGWARLPLAAAGLIAVLMAYARLSPPEPAENAIDITPLILPPMIFVFAAIALFMTAIASKPDHSQT